MAQEKIKEFTVDLLEKLKGITDFFNYTLDNKIYTVMIVLFVLAVFPLPYEFYNTLRTLICVGLGYYLHSAYQQKDVDVSFYKYALIGLIVLYNPLIPIHLTKPLWTLINLATLYFIYTYQQKLKQE